ncbi:MAG: VWA domain-containing protein [Terriglobales bacterium]
MAGMVAGLFTGVAAGVAQLPQMQFSGHAWRPGFSFSTQANLIEMPVVVTGRDGQAVDALRADDFEVRDNGRPQAVTLFQMLRRSGPATTVRTSGQPPAGAAPTPPVRAPAVTRSVALVFDDLNASPTQLAFMRRAAARYVATAGGAGERFAVLTTSRSEWLPFTADRDAVVAALSGVNSHAEITGGGASTAPAPTSGLTEPMHGGGNSDEMLETLAQRALDGLRQAILYTGTQPGSKTVVLASPGFATRFPADGMNLDHELEVMIADALHTRVIVSAIDSTQLQPMLVTQHGAATLDHWTYEADVLNTLTHATGGELTENSNALVPAYQRLGEGPAVSYVLGFAPAHLRDDGSYHRLTVTLRPGLDAGAKIRARLGYYAPEASSAAGLTATLDSKLGRALGGANLHELDAEAVAKPLPGHAGVHVIVVVDTRKLPYVRWPGVGRQPPRWRERVRLTCVLLDGAGKYLAGEQGVEQLAVSAATRKRLEREGLQLGVQLPAPLKPGRYRLQIVVQEGARGLTTGWTRAFTLP